MAQDSRRLRQLRRLRRERTIAYRMLDHTIKERNGLRELLNALGSKMRDAAAAAESKDPAYTITSVPDEVGDDLAVSDFAAEGNPVETQTVGDEVV